MRSAIPLVVLLAATGCGTAGVGEPEVIAYTTNDLPVDHSLEATVGAPRMGVAGANGYAVWHDDRRAPGRNQVFFNVGRGGGVHWGEGDVQLSSDPEGTSVAENPTIACAGDSVYVAWEDDRDSEFGHKSIYFTYSDDGGDNWVVDQLVTLDPEGEWDAQGPALAVEYDPDVGPDKHIYFAWYDNRLGAYDIYFTRSTNGYNFLPQGKRLDTDTAGSAYSAHPRLLVDGEQGVYVAWEDSRDGGNDVYFNRSLDRGDSWLGDDVRLDGGDDGGASDAFGVAMAIDTDNGDESAVYAVWHDGRNGSNDIYLNYAHDSGTTWQADAVRIENDGPGASESFYPTVVASDDRVVVGWHDDRDIGFDIWMRGSENGGLDWGSEMRLDTDVAGSAHSLGTKLVGIGPNLVAVWTDHRRPAEVADGHPDIYYRTSNDGGFVWSANDVRVDDDPQSTGISDQPQVVMAGPSVYVLWVDYRAGNADLWFRRMPSTAPGG